MLHKRIIEIFGMRGKVGDFGVEIEVEGARLPRAFDKFWTYHEDGSLRGEAAEYVLAQPLSQKKVSDALDYLHQQFKASTSTFTLSRRTSVHVHLNVQKMRLQEVYNLLTIYAIFEDLMVWYSGPERVGNLFCLRFRDAEYLPMAIANGIRQRTWMNFLSDQIRYAACNLNALRTYGSIEFRSFRGSVDKYEIKAWVDVIHCLKAAAYKYDNPLMVVEDYIKLGDEAFLRKVMPADFVTCVMANPQWEKKMEHGMLYAYEIAYATKWPELGKEEPLTADPRFDDYDEWVPEAFAAYCQMRGINLGMMNDRTFQSVIRDITAEREENARRAVRPPQPAMIEALLEDDDYDIDLVAGIPSRIDPVNRLMGTVHTVWTETAKIVNEANGAPGFPGALRTANHFESVRAYMTWRNNYLTMVHIYNAWQREHRHPHQRIMFQ